MRVFFVLLLGCVLAGSFARNASAQTSTGSIRGYVTDSAATPDAQATVFTLKPFTSTQRVVTTQSNGFYAMLGLVPAEYEVTARQIGMAPQKLRVRVLIGEVYPLDFKLGTSAIQIEAVTIEAAAGVETRTSEVATNVTQQQIKNLPSSSRNFLDLAVLAPGTGIQNDRLNGTARAFSAGAQAADQTNLFIDGASYKNDLIHGGSVGQDRSRGNPFPRNAVQEYRILTQNYKAEYQKASSAIITATTKSGGNEWTGNTFYSYQNKDLVALDTFARAAGTPKPDYSRNLAGLSVGGPLIKNKLRFFGSYEGNYQNRNNRVNIVPPTGYPALDTIDFASRNGFVGSPFRSTLLLGKLSPLPGSEPVSRLFNNFPGGDAQLGPDITIQDFTQKRIALRNDLTYSGLQWSGQHVIKTGASIDLLNYRAIKENGVIPRFFFQPIGHDATRPDSFKLPDRVEFRVGNPNFVADNMQVGAYVQDDWSPTQRLTLNLGIRWDYEARALNYDYITPQPIVDSLTKYKDS